MNRRDFLSFLSVAPVALPMAAKAMGAESPVVIGVDSASTGDRFTYAVLTESGWESGYACWLTPNEVLSRERGAWVIATAEPHAHVSPESENSIASHSI